MAIEIPRILSEADTGRVIGGIDVLQAEALYYYKQTGLAEFLKRYAFAVKGEIVEGQSALEERGDARNIYWPRRKESIIVSVLWQETRLTPDGGEHWHSAVGLETHPNGAVSIHGGIVFDRRSSPGSSYLTIDEWKDNKAAQERALKKAFEIPLITYFESRLFGNSTHLH